MVQVSRDEFWRSQAILGGERPGLKLRSFGRKVGDAIMCERCDGDGVIVAQRIGWKEPVKCTRCGGEGLEPPL